MSTDEQIEQEIQAKGLTAPRVTLQDINLAIASEFYFVGGDGVYGDALMRGDQDVQAFPESLDRLTFCILCLHNGYTVVGTSACVSPENFDAEVGKKIARQNAVNQLWGLMGFNLATRLHEQRTLGTMEHAS